MKIKNISTVKGFLSITKIIGVFVLLVLVSCTNSKLSGERPNIIVILLDDAGYNDFGFMGSTDLKTPNIDKLANAGTIFTDAHVSASVCCPSRAGLLTGRYQQRFGNECNPSGLDYGLDTSEVLLSTALKGVGYKTAVIGKWHLGHSAEYHPNNRGFDYFYGFLDGGRSYFPNEKQDKKGNSKAILENNEHVKFEGYLTDVLGDKAIEFIDKNESEPFFMYLSYNAVHTPMHATKDDLKLFEGHPRQTLAAMTWAVDRSIGNVINKLKEDGIYDNTLIFFLSDNGGAHNNQSTNLPLKGYKGNQFEGGHRIPFFATLGDKIYTQENFKGLTSSLDIYATCIDVAGVENYNGKPLDGTSLVPYLTGEKSGDPHETLFWRKANMSAIRQGDFKLLEVDYLGNRLYDVESDLAELSDLSSAKPEKIESLKAIYRDWENELMEPLWVEGPIWDSISTLINLDLYENKIPRVKGHKNLNKAIREIKRGIKNGKANQ